MLFVHVNRNQSVLCIMTPQLVHIPTAWTWLQHIFRVTKLGLFGDNDPQVFYAFVCKWTDGFRGFVYLQHFISRLYVCWIPELAMNCRTHPLLFSFVGLHIPQSFQGFYLSKENSQRKTRFKCLQFSRDWEILFYTSKKHSTMK